LPSGDAPMLSHDPAVESHSLATGTDRRLVGERVAATER
jgi:hypothetical protein